MCVSAQYISHCVSRTALSYIYVIISVLSDQYVGAVRVLSNQCICAQCISAQYLTISMVQALERHLPFGVMPTTNPARSPFPSANTCNDPLFISMMLTPVNSQSQLT